MVDRMNALIRYAVERGDSSIPVRVVRKALGRDRVFPVPPEGACGGQAVVGMPLT